MADKTIGDLNNAPGTVDDSNTLFVVQQAGTAYKLDGHAFILALTSILDGHGGISSIVYTAPVSPSLDGTLTITLADQSVTTLTVRNGKGIVSIAKTGTAGLVDTYTITYNDGTTGTFTVTNGAKGDTGDAWYVWIRYAGQQPTQDSDMGTSPDNWMGIYSGTSSTAPTHYTDYQWFQIKGAKGDTGNPATIQSTAIEYQASSSGTTVPSGTWSTTIPSVTQGQYLWTRTTVTFNSGSPVVWYSVSYIAIDGSGSPGTATPLVDSGSGAVGVAMSYSRQDHQHPLNVATTGTPQMDGTASRGSEPTYARSDHIHPHDTSKADIGLGITGATVGKVPVISAVDGNGVPTAFDAGDGGDVTADMLGIVIDGNSTPVGASAEQYVIVKNSTISGITDGLYTAAQAIPANTAIDFTYLTAVSDGGLNSVLSRTQWVRIWTNASPNSSFPGQDVTVSGMAGFDEYRIQLSDYMTASAPSLQLVITGYGRGEQWCFNGARFHFRDFTSTASGVTFGNASTFPTYGVPRDGTIDNAYMIPWYIEGKKN